MMVMYNRNVIMLMIMARANVIMINANAGPQDNEMFGMGWCMFRRQPVLRGRLG